MKVISKLISTRKDLDGVHTLRYYGRPLSLQQNVIQAEIVEINTEMVLAEKTKEIPEHAYFTRRFVFYLTPLTTNKNLQRRTVLNKSNKTVPTNLEGGQHLKPQTPKDTVRRCPKETQPGS